MNILKLITDSSIMVKFILLVLLFFSVFSWAIIFFKRKTVRSASSQSKKFMRAFRQSNDLTELSKSTKKFRASPLVALFQSGYKELAYQSKARDQNSASEKIDSINRALLRASNKEISRLERMMSFLATAGSVTPFIGLFGTVWGIMDSFHRIGIVRSASLDTVAPGIAEALVATAAGLFTAVPAVIAYNYFLNRIKDLITEMEDFSLEFLSIAERLYGP